MFNSIILDQNSLVTIRCNELIDGSNIALGNALASYKSEWMDFWDPSLSLSGMQGQIDKLASLPGDVTYPNALAKYFGVAAATITFLSTVIVNPFSEALTDSTGHFKQYFGPGWVCPVDGNGRPVFNQAGSLTLTGPCQWVTP